jgi:hypothetical protein
MSERMWISRYALRDGTCTWLIGNREGGGTFFYDWGVQYKIGTDAHETEQAANAAAEAARVKKIAALRKQLARLEAMTFTAGGAGEPK